jgi:hypothetical protein
VFGPTPTPRRVVFLSLFLSPNQVRYFSPPPPPIQARIQMGFKTKEAYLEYLARIQMGFKTKEAYLEHLARKTVS